MATQKLEKNQNRIAFLFGAGADPICYFGKDFTKEFLRKRRDTIIKLITIIGGQEKRFNTSELYEAYNEFFDDSRTTFSTFRSQIYERTLHNFIQEHKYNDWEKESVLMLAKMLYNRSEFEKLFGDEGYVSIQEIGKTDRKKLMNLVLEDIGLNELGDSLKQFSESFKEQLFKFELINYGTIEKYFHTIIKPKKYGQKDFIDLIYAYWRAYFGTYFYLEILVENELTSHNRKKKYKNKYSMGNIQAVNKSISSKLRQMFSYKVTGFCVDNHLLTLRSNSSSNLINCGEGELYYNFSWVRESAGIITTNYTPCAEWFFKDNQNIAYLHGKLSWFEFPFSLEVVDCINQEKLFNDLRSSGQIYFPFIMATSSIKPIVHPLQLKEHCKAQSILDNSDILVIIGHSLSEDDTHIISIIRTWLLGATEHKLIYCAHGHETNETDNQKKIICKKLRLPYSCEQITILTHTQEDLLEPKLAAVLNR